MAIGIVDLDLILFPKQYQPNLDVMQLVAYYKRKGENIKISLSNKPEDLGWFSKIYLIYNGFKEIYIDNFLKDDRVILVGSYFYGKSISLPQEIIDTYPDFSAYDAVLRTDYLSKYRKNLIISAIHRCDFLRIHQTTNLNFLTQDKPNMILYDPDLDAKDYQKILELNKRFKLYYPIKVRCLARAWDWINIQAFARTRDRYSFVATGFTEKDLKEYLKLPFKYRRLFLIEFGNCSEDLYSYELKKMIRFVQEAKKDFNRPKITVLPIHNKTYDFLFDCVKKWYNGNYENQEQTIFQRYFKKKEHFDLMKKIKAKDPELYQLLASTLMQRYENEQARKNYRRVD